MSDVVRIRENEAKPKESVTDPASLSGRVSIVRSAWREFGSPRDNDDWPSHWVAEIYEDHLLVQHGDDLFRVSYTYSDDHKVTFGALEPVTVDLTIRAIEAQGDEAEVDIAGYRAVELIESLDDNAGWQWRMKVVRQGVSHNGYRYTTEVLQEAATLYEGVHAHDGHRDNATRNASPMSTVVGFWSNPSIDSDGDLAADLTVMESASWLRSQLIAAHESGRPGLVGVSHDVSARVVPVRESTSGRGYNDVRQITRVHSADVVADPSAGGRMERLIASKQRDKEGRNMWTAARLAKLLGITEAEAQLIIDKGDEAIAEAIDSYEPPKPAEPITEADPAPAAKPETTPDAPPEPAAPAAFGNESVVEAGSTLASIVLNTALTEANLPTGAADEIRKQFAEGTFTAADVDARIGETQRVLSAVGAIAPAGDLTGQGPAVQVTADEYDRKVNVLEATLSQGRYAVKDKDGAPVAGYRSLREAYYDFTGRHDQDRSLGGRSIGEWMFAESLRTVPVEQASAQLRESVLTSTWASAMGETMHRILIQEYSLDPLQSWKRLVSQNSPMSDFKTHRRERIGGFDVLPTVAENAAYAALTTPSDEEGTFALQKYGGLETVTMEAFANDDIGAIARVPRNMGRAAAVTLYNAVWITTIEGNANTTYDATALFDAAHNNTAAGTALDEATVDARRQAMVLQQRQGETSGFIGIDPRFLVVPTAQKLTADKLTKSVEAVGASNNEFNTASVYEVIEVPLFADANDYYLMASPSSVPMIEMGWFQGRQDPEILVQDGPTIGSVFTNDRVTYKIRHIWTLLVLDHRGFQRVVVT